MDECQSHFMTRYCIYVRRIKQCGAGDRASGRILISHQVAPWIKLKVVTPAAACLQVLSFNSGVQLEMRKTFIIMLF